MSHDLEFHRLLQRVRAGDARAAEELVRAYEGDIRRAIRVRMTDARLRQLVDSVDICQSVLAHFFVRFVAGQFDVESPRQLIGLLVTMARNRLTDFARQQRAARRDGRRTLSLEGLSGPDAGIPGNDPSPSAVLEGDELRRRILGLLTTDERKIFESRIAGSGWIEIAERLDAHPNTVRMRYVRALDRVSTQLGLGITTDA